MSEAGERRPTAAGAEYIARIEALVGDQNPVSVLESTPDVVSDTLRSTARSDRERPEAPGRWSLRDVVLHLADAELVYAERLRVVLTAPGTPYPPFDQAARLDLLRACAGSLTETVERFRLMRTDSLRLVARLDPAARARSGLHESRGRETIEQLVRRWAGHDLVHRAQMERIRAALSP